MPRGFSEPARDPGSHGLLHRKEADIGGVSTTYKIWRFLARYLAPTGILFVFLKAVGVLDWILGMTG